jgi:hypothetical protein
LQVKKLGQEYLVGEETERLEGVGEKRVLSACPSMVSVKSFPPMNNLSAGLFPLIYLLYLQSTLSVPVSMLI